MAARESQGLQISLILFVIVSLVLAVTTYVFYSSAEDARSAAERATATAASAGDRADQLDFKVQYFKHILGIAPLADAELNLVRGGWGEDADMTAIDDAFQLDMANYGEGMAAEKRNYRELPLHLTMALKNKNVANAQLADQLADLQKEKETLEQAEKARTAEAQQGMRDAAADLQAQRATFDGDRNNINKEKETLFKQLQDARGQRDKDIAVERKRAEDAMSELEESQKTIEDQKGRIEQLVDQPFETPDGQVYWVNQRSRSVWINLGKADGLRRQTTFSVFDREAMNVAPGRSSEEDGRVRKADIAKGKIEITSVFDDHLAEGRIVEDDPANPILRGDQVFSPAWKPGRRVRFALVGMMDIDRDRRSDRDLVRNIVHQGGGEIDAEVLDDGSVRGELSPTTRYLVRGEAPTSRAVLTNYTQMIKQAQDLGIQEISIDILLDLMGYKPEARTLPLGRRRGNPNASSSGGGEAGDESNRGVRTPPAGF